MDKAVINISCVNPQCQAPNPTDHHFCQQCQTPLVKNYLWALNPVVTTYAAGTLLADRYVHIQDRVVLDTLPQRLPAMPSEISADLAAYLSLIPWRLQVPQPYGLLYLPDKMMQAVVLLEQAPLDLAKLRGPMDADAPAPLLPSLREAWPHASALRQLNWLLQIARLWAPFQREGVVSTLLDPALVRVEGPWVRLLELAFDRDRPDPDSPPNLVQLGACWQAWLTGTQPVLAPFLTYLWGQMQQQQVPNSDYLALWLDQALFQYHQLHREALEKQGVPERSIQIATQTDRGPSRERNEDACYPCISMPPGQTQLPLAIVCDGLGGHEGGSVASQLAIATLPPEIQKLPLNRPIWNPRLLTTGLEQAVFAANDAINQRNNDEQRHERQRMGTTLVMALANHHEVYITHVGDSRLYWITRHGCHQVTLDDDIASRDVRLGYCLYRESTQGSISGALIQAVGMGPASQLFPTTQRWVMDEDCVLLLCSDGLSDNDRVEQFWQTELLPILTEQRDIATASQRLIELANRWNGHDNVTVALMACQVAQTPTVTLDAQTLLARLTPAPSLPDAPTQLEAESLMALPETVTTGIPTEIRSVPAATTTSSRSRSVSAGELPFRLGLLAVVLVLGLGGLGLWLSYRFGRLNLPIPTATTALPEPESVPLAPASPAPSPTLGDRAASPQENRAASPQENRAASPQENRLSPSTPLTPAIGQVFTLSSAQILWPEPNPTLALNTDADRAQQLPQGSFVQLLRQQTIAPAQTWVQVRLCGWPNPPDAGAGTTAPVVPIPRAEVGELGWLRLEGTPNASQPWAVPPTLPANLDPACAPTGIRSEPSDGATGQPTTATDSPAVPLPPRRGESPNG